MAAVTRPTQCGHCKSLTPTWESLAQKLNEEKEAGDVTPIIAKVDGTVSPKLQGRCHSNSCGEV